MLLHPSRFEPEERVKQIVCVAAQECAGQPDDSVSAGGQSAQSIALRRIASQLVNLVTNGVVKPFRHVAPDALNWGHAADLVRIRLPEWAVQRTTRFLSPGLNGLGNLDFLKLTGR